MKTLKLFIDKITSTNSRNEKEEILKEYKEDEDIKYYLNFIYNPYIVTGISTKKLEREVKKEESYITTVKDMLEFLKHNNTGSDKVLGIVQDFMDKLVEYKDKELNFEYVELFKKIISKDLQLGIQPKTINKIIPKLIPEFNVQLADRYFDCPEYVEGKKFVITTKIDGMRCIAIKKDGVVKFWSRQGQEITGLVDLEQEMKYKLIDNIALDGELVAIVNSPDTYKETMKKARNKDEEKHGLRMLVFDCMTAEEFENQYCKEKYFARRANLLAWFGNPKVIDISEFIKENLKKESKEYKRKLLETINQEYTYFNLLPILYQGTDTKEITKWLDYNTSKGEEGIMINLFDGLYEFKRTKNLLKVKKFQTADVRVVGIKEGAGRNKNKVGAFIIEFIAPDGNIYQNEVGSGLSDFDREHFWDNKEEIIGKIIEIGYFEITTNQNGTYGLRFPTYNWVREDKTEISMY